MKIGVFPHKSALILDQPGTPLLVSMTNAQKKSKKGKGYLPNRLNQNRGQSEINVVGTTHFDAENGGPYPNIGDTKMQETVCELNWEIAKMDLKIPGHLNVENGPKLKFNELQYVGQILQKIPAIDKQKCHIFGMFVVTEKQFEDEHKVQYMREQILQDFGGVVIIEELPPPPLKIGRATGLRSGVLMGGRIFH